MLATGTSQRAHTSPIPWGSCQKLSWALQTGTTRWQLCRLSSNGLLAFHTHPWTWTLGWNGWVVKCNLGNLGLWGQENLIDWKKAKSYWLEKKPISLEENLTNKQELMTWKNQKLLVYNKKVTIFPPIPLWSPVDQPEAHKRAHVVDFF